MTFTIEQLEALKEGITPGLWAATNPPYSPHNPPEIFDAETASLILRIDPETDHPGYADQNLQLLAASPALLNQLIETIEINVQLTNRLIGVEVQAETAEHDRKLAWREMDAARAKAGVLSAENARLRKGIQSLIEMYTIDRDSELETTPKSVVPYWPVLDQIRRKLTQVLEGHND